MPGAAPRPTFGICPPGVTCEPRPAAYAVILDSRGRVAAVRESAHWFLPGGGSLAGESPEATVLREIREECGCGARIIDRLGEAVQVFRDSTRWYEMLAIFFRAELDGQPTAAGEYEVFWLEPGETGGFFHECHVWALARAREDLGSA